MMYESANELNELQRMLDASASTEGAHMRSIFKPEHRLSASQVSSCLQGVIQVAVATVSSKGEPSVAPVDAVFYRAKFVLSTDKKSLRARHLARNPALSVTYFEGADPVVIAHGRARFIGPDDPEFADLDKEWVKAYGSSILGLSNSVVFVRLEPRLMFAFAFHPERFKDTRRVSQVE
jgi:hypothetical protein